VGESRLAGDAGFDERGLLSIGELTVVDVGVPCGVEGGAVGPVTGDVGRSIFSLAMVSCSAILLFVSLRVNFDSKNLLTGPFCTKGVILLFTGAPSTTVTLEANRGKSIDTGRALNGLPHLSLMPSNSPNLDPFVVDVGDVDGDVVVDGESMARNFAERRCRRLNSAVGMSVDSELSKSNLVLCGDTGGAFVGLMSSADFDSDRSDLNTVVSTLLGMSDPFLTMGLGKDPFWLDVIVFFLPASGDDDLINTFSFSS